ncbi:MAG: acyltransferase family protein [Anaerolineae bacterium]
MAKRSSKTSAAQPKAGNGGPRLPYLPGLDGLRAVAVLAVIAYHADMGWLSGGFLGVEVFFVISGYLITSLLVAEWEQHDRIDFKSFWLRRARRLLPAVYVLIAAVLTITVLFLPDEVASLRGDAAAAVAYVTNWWLIVSQKSYFEAVGRPSLLRHLWSLAVEEQFYLVWPLIIAGMLALLWRGKRLLAIGLVVGAAIASSIWMGILYQPDVDPSRIYYGTDTRAAGFLLGAALALVWSPFRLRRPDARSHRVALDVVGFAALAGLLIAGMKFDEFTPFLYHGGFLLVGLITAAAIAAVVHPGAKFFPLILGWGILRWIGLRSYGIYLWHWPVFMLTRPELDVTIGGWTLLAARLAITFVLAEISYRAIETPIRNGFLGRAWAAFKSSQGPRRRRLTYGWAAIAAALTIFVAALSVSAATAREPAPPPYLAVQSIDTFDMTPAPATSDKSATVGAGLNSAPTNATGPADTPAQAGIGARPTPTGLPAAVLMRVDDTAAPTAAPEVSQEIASSAGSGSAQATPELVPPPVGESPKHPWGISGAPTATATPPTTREAIARVAVNVRQGPSRDFGVVNVLDEGERVTLIGRTADNVWYKIRTEDNGEGWIAAEFLTVEGANALAVVPTPTPPPANAGQQATGAAAPVAPIVPANIRVTAIGDSVMLGAVTEFQRLMGSVNVDAAVGRQASQAIDILRMRRDAGQLGQAVVVHVGSNGTFNARQLETLMEVLQNTKRVIIVNDKVPRTWQEPNNRMLAESVSAYPNAVLVDWNSIGNAHPEYFWNDGIHLRPEGAHAYATLIAQAIMR